MLCPVCKTQTLQMAERHGIEIDYCPSCRGYGWIVASWTRSSSVRVLQYLRQRPCRLSRRPRRHR